ncbi:MAG: UbiD family decarboxylase [Chloroflexi bacterium]|nr:UbiD family decarboxylase [Chloroflexota bacterium]
MPFTDLRQFLNYLEDKGQLRPVAEEVDPEFEVARRMNQAARSQGPALLFQKVRGSPMPLVGGVYATRERLFMAMECTEQTFTERLTQGMAQPLAPTLVASGPCQEVVLLGDDADLTRLPVPTFSPQDGGPYITLGLVFTKDPETGVRNMSIIRIQLKGKRRLGIMARTYHHTGVHLGKAEAQGRPLEIAIAIGGDPVIPIASQWRAPYGVDELGLAGALRREPVPLVKCRTVDLEVPANAEIVIEGRIPPGVREMEGPFGEAAGYYTPASPKPVVEVSAITHRRAPIFHAVLCGPPTLESHLLTELISEATHYRTLKADFAGVKAVHQPTWGVAFVSMRQHTRQEARSVLAALLSKSEIKMGVVVDDDIDVFSLDKVLWAIATRSQPDKDTVIMPAMPHSGLDPSSDGGVSAKMGIDATRPFGQPFAEVAALPE